MVEIDLGHQAAFLSLARTDWPCRIEHHQPLGIDEHLDLAVGFEIVNALRQHHPAHIGKGEMDKALRAGDFGDDDARFHRHALRPCACEERWWGWKPIV